jgi:hypothetical protein
VLSNIDYKVIEVVVKFNGKGLYEPYQGTSIMQMLQFLFKYYGWTTNPLDVVKELEKNKYLVCTESKWYFTSLCTCGRCNRWINRKQEVRRLESTAGRKLQVVRQIISGKDLNFTDKGELLPLKGDAAEDKDWRLYVKSKQSKKSKPKTNQRAARVWNETTFRITRKDMLVQRKARIEQMIKELE